MKALRTPVTEQLSAGNRHADGVAGGVDHSKGGTEELVGLSVSSQQGRRTR